MLITDVYYDALPERFYVIPYPLYDKCRIDFPVNVEKVDSEDEENAFYKCDVYYLKTTYVSGIEEKVKRNFDKFFEAAKSYREAKT